MFSSANAVDAFMQRLLAGVQDLRALHGVRLCGIGPATAERITRYGLKMDVTPPERKVVFLVGRRQSDRAIAASLGLSQESVRDHLAQACRKLGLQSRAEAGRWAVKVGLAQ